MINHHVDIQVHFCVQDTDILANDTSKKIHADNNSIQIGI